jgi:hypothetical protein
MVHEMEVSNDRAKRQDSLLLVELQGPFYEQHAVYRGAASRELRRDLERPSETRLGRGQAMGPGDEQGRRSAAAFRLEDLVDLFDHVPDFGKEGAFLAEPCEVMLFGTRAEPTEREFR